MNTSRRFRVRPQLEELEGRELLSSLPISAAEPASAVYSVGPTVTPTTTAPEAEESIAVDPNNSQNLSAAVIDFGSARSVHGLAGLSTTKVAVSSNNGATWASSYIPVNANPFSPTFGFLPTADGQEWDWNGDPVVAMDQHGNVYLSSIYSDKITQGVNGSSGLYVGVQSFTALGTTGLSAAQMHPVHVDLGSSAAQHVDKDWITVDNSNSAFSGTVYVCWTEDVAKGQQVVEVSRSTDQGQTWSAPVAVSAPSQTSVTGSEVAVGPNGEVYVAYVATPTKVSHLVGGRGQIFLAASTNGGQSFSAPAAITPTFRIPFFPAVYQKASFPSLAVSPTNGNVYVAYSAQRSLKRGAQVEFIRSLNGGATFSAPTPINDVSRGQHFQPAITVDSSGVVHAIWLDTRNRRSRLNSTFDVYAAFSSNNGASFSPNVRVTQTPTHTGLALFIGDYTSIAAAGGFAHPVWSNGSLRGHRNKLGLGTLLTGGDNSRLQTATLTLPAS
jgi:hypothetical protein